MRPSLLMLQKMITAIVIAIESIGVISPPSVPNANDAVCVQDHQPMAQPKRDDAIPPPSSSAAAATNAALLEEI